MVVEKSTAPVDVNAQRSDALRKRVLAQEWAGVAMQDLITQVGELAAQPPNLNVTEYTAKVEKVAALCDRVSIAAEVAAASIRVTGDERLDLASDTSRIEADVAREELEVQRLRKQLEREMRAVDHRQKLEAVAKILLQLPSPDELERRLQQANKEIADVEADIVAIENAKAAVARELRLLLQCASSVGDSAKTLSALVAPDAATDESKTEAKSSSIMDTTD